MKLGALYKALLGWQNYADDEMAEHLFYADVSPYAPDELTEEYWPVLVGEQIVPMRLPTDGDEKGEFSVWILPVDCALLNGDISSFRLRTTDDINNWRRSPEFVVPIPDLEIVQPSGCGETPEDRCDFACGSTVTFEAEITGLQYVESLEQSIDWYVLQDDGQGGWNELDKEHYPEDSGFQSIITQESWTGPSFTVLLKDHEFQVRAELLVCGDTLYDDCFVKDPLAQPMFRGQRYPDPHINDWNDECHYNYDPNDDNHVPPDKRLVYGSPGDGFVVGRSTGDDELSLYAITLGQAPNHRVPVEVKAPCDTTPCNWISVYLYELADSDPERDEIMADFTCDGTVPGPYVYGRGDHIYDPAITGVPPGGIPKVRITDSQPSSSNLSTIEFEPPYLYVSNRDQEKDYSVLVANDPENPWWQVNLTQMRLWVAPKAHYGQNRGYFALNNYDGEDGQQNYKESALKMGQEVVVASANILEKATLPVQSMPDIAFIFSHGGPSTLASHPPGCDGYTFDLAYWPTQPGLSPQGADANISPYDLRDACPIGSDTEWITLTGCNALNAGTYGTLGVALGYDDWEYIIRTQKNTSITTVCGFSGETRSWPWMGDFMQKLSDNLVRPTGGYNKDHWDPTLGTTKPREIVVIAWMEAAIYYIYKYTWNDGGGLMKYAMCVSIDETWVLENFGSGYKPDWRARIY